MFSWIFFQEHRYIMSQFCSLVDFLKLWCKTGSPSVVWGSDGASTHRFQELIPTMMDSRSLQHGPGVCTLSLLPAPAGSSMQIIFCLFWETLIKIRMGEKNIFVTQLPHSFLISSFTFLHLSTHLWHLICSSSQTTSTPYTVSILFPSRANPSFPPLSGNIYPLISEGLKNITPAPYEPSSPPSLWNAPIILHVLQLEWLL